MTARVDTQAAKERAETRRRLAKWSTPAEASRMGKSGYAPRKGQLAEWVVETCDDVLALVGLLADAEKALREREEEVAGWEAASAEIENRWRALGNLADDADSDGDHVGFARRYRALQDGMGEALRLLRPENRATLAAFDAAGGAGE